LGVRTHAVALVFLLASPPAGAANDYTTPYGEWRGQAQFHARVGAEYDPKAHSVTDFAITIGPQGKLTGESAGTGCRALGLAAPSGPKTVFNLDVTFSGCTYPGYNRRFTGNLFLYPKDSYASLRLRSLIANTGKKSVNYDIRATLKR
jgi:hypothetical protein